MLAANRAAVPFRAPTVQHHARQPPLHCAAAIGSRRSVVCAAYGRRGEPDYYELLGIGPDASEDDIKSAFRRKAKEVHPDVGGADEDFIAVTKAYETLSDPDKRASYDRTNGLRRLNFFRDVDDDYAPFRTGTTGGRTWGTGGFAARPGDDEDAYGYGANSDSEEPSRGSRRWRPRSVDDDDDVSYGRDGARGGFGRGGFGWGHVGAEPPPWEGYKSRQRKPKDLDEDEEEGEEEGEEEEEEEEPGPKRMSAAEEEAKQLEELMRIMSRLGPDNPLTRLQRGGVDPWGSSTTESWQRRVQEQVRDPFGGRGGFGGRPTPGAPGSNPEWTAPGRGFEDDDGYRRPGWTPPGRGSEWGRPGQDEGGRGGGQPRRGWGDDGGFRGKPL